MIDGVRLENSLSKGAATPQEGGTLNFILKEEHPLQVQQFQEDPTHPVHYGPP